MGRVPQEVCRRGHKFTPSNTQQWIRDGRIHRRCRTCKSMKQKLRYAKHKQDLGLPAIDLRTMQGKALLCYVVMDDPMADGPPRGVVWDWLVKDLC